MFSNQLHETTSVRAAALRDMTNQLRSSLSQWRLQAGQRAPFIWGLRNATIDKQSTIIQAGWLIAPALAELCYWERFRLPIRVHSEPACVARQEVMDDNLLSIDVAETMAPPSVSNSAPQAAARWSSPSLTANFRGDDMVQSSVSPATQIWQPSTKPFEPADSPLGDLRAYVFHPYFAAASTADVRGPPLCGALEDPALHPSNESKNASAPLQPALVLCIAEYVAELLQVRMMHWFMN